MGGEKRKDKRQAGNVIILILIGVALFAALGYALSTGRGSSGNALTKEQAVLGATEINAYLLRMDSTVKKLKRINGCADNQFSFENTTSKFSTNANANPVGGNPSAPTSGLCNVHGTAGGNMPVWLLPAGIKDAAPQSGTWKAGNPVAVDIRIADQGTDAADDLVYVYPFVDNEVCLAFNRLKNVSNPGGKPPVGQAYNSNHSFDGVYDSGAFGATPVSERSFCASWDGLNTHDNHIYHVLIAR